MSFRLGTRGSVLALAQAEEIASVLRSSGLDESIETVIVKTSGDRDNGPMNPSEGSFVDEINRQILGGKIDGGIHSMKDLPVRLPDSLCVAAVPKRKNRLDCIVSKTYYTALRPGSTVGTSSARRIAQLRKTGRDIRAVSLRGNLTTRLMKVEREEVDAAVVAGCGLERIGYAGRGQIGVHPLPLEQFVPAAGQGALALVTREGRIGSGIVSRADHAASREETNIERSVLLHLGAGCNSPLGVSARFVGRAYHLRVQLLSIDGKTERLLSCLVKSENELEDKLRIFDDEVSQAIIKGGEI